VLEVELTHRFGDFELSAAFSLEARGLVAVFGPSGSGKTSLINFIAGLLRPQHGRIVFNGKVLCDTRAGIHAPPYRRHIGYVFQDSLLFPHLSVRNNLIYGNPGDEAGNSISFERVVEVLGIGDLLARQPHTLSGGERSRVALGRALLSQPQLLLMDEPLSSLDGARKQEVMTLIEQVRDQFMVPIIYVTHSVDEILRLAGNLVLMRAGRVIATGNVEEIFSRLDLGDDAAQPDSGAVITVAVASHDPEYALSTLEFAGGKLIVPRVARAPGEKLRLRILARDVTLSLSRPTDTSVQNIFAGRIAEIGAAHGPYVDMRVDIGAPILARLTRKSADRLSLAPGAQVYAQIKAVAISAS